MRNLNTMTGPWRLKRFRILFVFALIVALAYVSLQADTLPVRDSTTGLRIATANLLYNNQEADALARVLVSTHSDLILILECSAKNFDASVSSVYRAAGYKILLSDPRRGTHGTCVLGRGGWRFTVQRMPPPVSNHCMMPMATILMVRGGQRLGVLGVHAPPPITACGEGATARTLAALADSFKDGRLIRPYGAVPAGVPTVLMGDLNALPWSDGLARLRRAGLVDAYGAHRYSLGPTWPAIGVLPALARIDYILSPARIRVDGVWSINIPGSDHRAVVADIFLQ